MMTEYCKGCGVRLQDSDPTLPGYTPKLDKAYCQRCFRIRHYDDVVISMQQGIDGTQVLQRIAQHDALILWVVDIFDFEANLLPGLSRHLPGRDIVMIATKRDLLPQTLSDEKLAMFVLRPAERRGYPGGGHRAVRRSGAQSASSGQSFAGGSGKCHREVPSRPRCDRDGAWPMPARAPCSTGLCASADLTTSAHPGTTLDFVALRMEGYTLYDTPGITRHDSLLTHAPDALLREVIPMRPLKPRVFQLHEDQSYALGGMARLDVRCAKQGTVVAYFSERLKVHRGKAAKADELWHRHLGGLLSPTLDSDPDDMVMYSHPVRKEKIDVVIHGLGWFCVSPGISEVRVWVNRKVNVTFRKAMI